MGRRVRQKEIKKRQYKKKLILSGGVVAVAIILYIILCAIVPKGTILKGVSMNGVKVGKMTEEQAAVEIAKKFQEDYKGAALTVNALKKDYKMNMYSSLTLDAKSAAKEAYDYGHQAFFARGVLAVKAQLFGTKKHHYPELMNMDAFAKEYKASGLSAINTTVQTTYAVESNELLFKMGKTGYSVDGKGLTKAIKEAIAADDYETVIKSPMLKGTVQPINIDQVYQDVHKKKREATLDPKKNYKLVKSVKGIDFDKNVAKKAVQESKEGELVHVEIVVDKPKMTTKNLKKHLFKNTLGSCTTYVSGTNARRSNVRLAAEKLDGVILLPGESISYNETVGKRTEERGFQRAPAYSNGETVQELGGGVCQVSSTLYKATLDSNLAIVEHHNHTYVSSYIGIGMDATVSWDGPDFKFKNDTKYPIKIKTDYSDGELTCKIIGSKLDDHVVKMTADVLKTISYGTIIREDSTKYKGEAYIASSGHEGYIVQTYRNIYDGKGKKLSSTKEAYCVYSKKDQVKVVGTKEKEPVVPKPETTQQPGAATQPAGNQTTPVQPASN